MIKKKKEKVQHYTLFKTSLGMCGISWSEKGVTGFQLPEKTLEDTKQKLLEKRGDRIFLPLSLDSTSIPDWIKKGVRQIQGYLKGEKSNLSDIPVDLEGVPEFHKAVYQAAEGIPIGKVATYGELAKIVRSPGAARAVGNALAKNPIALIIPCHRIIGGDGKLGGFSAYGSLAAKVKLLELEGAQIAQKNGSGRSSVKQNGKDWSQVSSVSWDGAALALLKRDPEMADLIQRVGPCALKPDAKQDPFHAFLESILYQQLTSKAAQTILGRLKQLFSHGDFPTPQELLDLPLEKLRSAGISQNKALAARDLALKTMKGVIPTLSEAKKMSNESLIQQMTEVRGIGQWTVEMFLIFNLGRPDVLPVTDYGVRKGFARTFGKKELPSPKQLEAYGEKWKPYRTTAAWYLWRALELP